MGHSRVFNSGLLKFTFFMFQEQFVLAKSFKYKSGDLVMFFKAFHEDENVV